MDRHHIFGPVILHDLPSVVLLQKIEIPSIVLTSLDISSHWTATRISRPEGWG